MKFVFTLCLFFPLVISAQDTVYINAKPRIISAIAFQVGDSLYQTTFGRDNDNNSVVFLLSRASPKYGNGDIINIYPGSPNMLSLKFNVTIQCDTLPYNPHNLEHSRMYIEICDSTKRFKAFGADIKRSAVHDFLKQQVQASVNGKPVAIKRVKVIFFDLLNNEYPCTAWPPTPPCRLTQNVWQPGYLKIENAFIIVDGKEIEIADIHIACKII